MSIGGGGISGASDLAQLVALISSDGSFKTKLSQIQEAQRQLNDTVALAGPANEVLKMRDQLKEKLRLQELADRASAEARGAAINDATREAQAIKQSATDTADIVRKSAQSDLEKLEARAQVARDAINDDAARKAKLEELRQQINLSQSRSEVHMSEVQSARDALNEKLAKIQAVHAHAQESLAKLV